MSTPLNAVTVTIGRNIPLTQNAAARRDGLADTINGNAVLTDEAWADFTTLVREALNTYADTIEANSWWLETHDGIAEWDGVPEESRKVTLLWDETQVLPSRLQKAREELVLELLSARTGFYQDAVALSFGESVLL